MPLSILSAAPSITHGAVVPITYYKFTSADSLTLANIPQNYQDLMIVISSRESRSITRAMFFGFNALAVSGTYSYTEVDGNGSSATSSRSTSSNQFGGICVLPQSNDTANVYGAAVINILNYANTTTYKTVIARSGYDANGSGDTQFAAGLWQNTQGINEIDFRNIFDVGTTIALYGIRTVGQ